MYNSFSLKKIHAEISTHCNASCPMCSRNINGGPLNPKLDPTHMSFATFATVFPEEILRSMKELSLCGNYGDPLMNPDLDEILYYIKQKNPDIFLEIHTNASMRDTDWWVNLPGNLPKNHLVHFAIDGLKDTHSLYRVGTNFDKIMLNARNFIGNDGKARGTFIKFKHNEHQTEDVKQLVNEYQFQSFQEKQTSRFTGTEKFEVINKNGNTERFLEQPTEAVVKFIPKSVIDNYKDYLKDVTIDCQVERESSVYVDVHGDVYPCCWVGAIPYTYYTDRTIGKEFLEDNQQQYKDMVIKQGDISALNRTIFEIINSIKWQDAWQEKTLLTCSKVCGKNTSSEQFINLDSFQ